MSMFNKTTSTQPADTTRPAGDPRQDGVWLADLDTIRTWAADHRGAREYDRRVEAGELRPHPDIDSDHDKAVVLANLADGYRFQTVITDTRDLTSAEVEAYLDHRRAAQAWATGRAQQRQAAVHARVREERRCHLCGQVTAETPDSRDLVDGRRYRAHAACAAYADQLLTDATMSQLIDGRPLREVIADRIGITTP